MGVNNLDGGGRDQRREGEFRREFRDRLFRDRDLRPEATNIFMGGAANGYKRRAIEGSADHIPEDLQHRPPLSQGMRPPNSVHDRLGKTGPEIPGGGRAGEFCDKRANPEMSRSVPRSKEWGICF